MKTLFVAILIVFIPILLSAQINASKFGKLDDTLVKMTKYELDSLAEAVVLSDYGVTTFGYDDNNNIFYYLFERVTKIKILTKDGLDYGDFTIPYYHDNGSNETVSYIKGYTYNYNNGSIEKSKLEKTSIFDEETTENWGQKKISMPNVKVGSVVELTYKIRSPYKWNLVTWEFQDYIPTAYSEYKAIIPEYYDYQLLQYGYYPIKHEHSTKSNSITIQTKERTGTRTVNTTFSSNKIDYTDNVYHWTVENVPAFKSEPYIASSSDYITKVKFELKGTRFPNSPYEAYMGTWQSLNKSFLENTYFGEAVKHTGFMNTELDKIAALSNDEEKITAMVDLVRNQVEWNGNYRRYSTSILRSAWNDKTGSTADINLMIVAGLKKLGFEADPVLISTRGHGIIRDPYAISNQFNSVIAAVKLKDKILLLDGTDHYLPVGVLPKKCLNEKGWKVSETSPGWVHINPASKQESTFQANFSIESNGIIAGDIELSDKGYSGYSANKDYAVKGDDKYFEEVQNKTTDWIIEDHEYTKSKSYNEPFISKYKVEFKDKAIASAKVLYFNPTLGKILEANPFKIEKREYPVDFAYEIRNLYIVKFTIPEGYTIEGLPKSTAFALPNNDAKFIYNISTLGNSLQLMVDFRINKAMFSQTEYPALKQFYELAVQKCAEQVVLKKSNP